MRNFKLLTTLLLLGAMAFLSGCGSDSGTETTEPETTATDSEASAPATDAEFLEEVRASTEMAEAAPAERAQIDPASTEAPPLIVLETKEFDMGMVHVKEHTIKQISIYNHGGQPLVISKVSTSCGCTTGRMLEDTIAPGQTGTLEIEIDPSRINGYRSRKVLTLASNDPVNPSVKLIVAAQIPGELLFSTRDFIFDTLEDGVAASKTLRVTQTTSEPVLIGELEVRGGPEFMTASKVDVPQDEWVDAEIPEFDLVVHISDASTAGRYAPTVKVPVEDGRGKRLSFPVRLTVRGDYSFEPFDITLRNVATGELQEGVSVLTSSVPLTVEEVTNTNPNVTVTLVPGEEPNSYRFDVTIPEVVENRLQKDEWTVSMLVDGKSVTETLKVVALMKRQ
ncbi:MAG: DUF1573 domain-containing protein [Candidatus Hydrogenedentota bacterium]